MRFSFRFLRLHYSFNTEKSKKLNVIIGYQLLTYHVKAMMQSVHIFVQYCENHMLFLAFAQEIW